MTTNQQDAYRRVLAARRLASEALRHRYGKTESETLAQYLSCEAFESRFDPQRAEAFGLAARIVGLMTGEHIPEPEG
jgi:hypothetical protein